MPELRRYLTVVDVEKLDRQVLALFPSINFYSSEVDEQRKKGMKTCLRVLCIAADRGCVNRYMLSNEYKIGGDSISRALKSLKRLKLLRAMPPTLTVKRGRRIDYVLTSKGVIACISVPRFQQVQELYSILLRFGDNMLARTLILLNSLSGPGDGTQITHAIRYVRELVDQGINLEQKSEDSISQNLLTVSEDLIMKQLDPVLDLYIEMPKYLTPQYAQMLYEQILSLMEMAREDPESYDRAMSSVKDRVKRLFSLLLGPEMQAWLRTKRSPQDVKKMIEECKRIVLSEISGDEGVSPRESLLDLMFGEDEKARTRRLDLFRKLRELFASEVTRKVQEIMNSCKKK